MSILPLPNYSQIKSPMRAAYESYIKHGFALVPIAQGSKGPRGMAWSEKQNCITTADRLPPDDIGVGIAHAYSGTMSLDIDDVTQATKDLAERGINLQELFDAPDSVTINSGNPGHAKLIYRMPFGMALPSKKLIYTTHENIKKNFLDFRCATNNNKTVQDVLPSAARHPSTLKQYQWGGNGHYSNLPVIPTALLTYWQQLLEQEKHRNIGVQGSQVSASWDEIRQALCHITPDCERTEWIAVLMALHHAGTTTGKLDEAFALADDWSSQSETKYKGQQDLMNSWRGFKPDGGVTLGTLFHMAAESGWKRPMPDVQAMFAPIEQTQSPKSLVDALHVPAPEFNIDLVPDILAKRAKEVAISIGCDPLVPVWAGIGAACAAVDARIRIELMEGWKEPPILWLCTIGSPSDKKTPAARPMLGILKQLESEDLPAMEIRKKTFEALDSAYAAAKLSYNKAAADPNWMLGGADFSALPEVPPQPQQPVPLRLTVSDITSQKLVRMCAERPRGLLCHLDEMADWAKKLTNPMSSDSRSSWVKSYNCDSETMDRVGNGQQGDANIIASNFAVSIYGNMQPRIFQHYLKPLASDGLIQRFIPAVLRDTMSDSKGEPIPAMLSCSVEYEQAIRRIYALSPTTYKLSKEAYKLFRDFQDWYHLTMKDERILKADPAYLTALGKIEGTCGRIMLFWHLFDDCNSIHVSAVTAQKAIDFVKTYIVNALRYAFGEIGGLNTDSIDQYVIEFILQRASEVETISLSDIRRSMRRRFDEGLDVGKAMTKQNQEYMIQDAMHALEVANWVKRIESTARSTVWAIDSRLANHYADHRKAIIAAKQRRIDALHNNSGGRISRQLVIGHDELNDD